MPTYTNVPAKPKLTLKVRLRLLATKFLADEPLIWTSKGNLPVAALRRVILWEDEPGYVKLIERYYLGDEVVKESADVLGKIMPAASSVATGRLGG